MFQIDMRMCDQITRIYERQAEESVRAVNRFYDDITAIARKTTFEPMVTFSNRILQFYDAELRSHLMHEFRKWYEGGYSFHALMSRIKAGNAAVSEARSKMNVMEEDLNRLFRHSGGQLSLDTSSPKIDNSDYEEYRQALSNAIRTFEGATDEAESAIRSMGSDNDVVNLIGDIVKTTGQTLQESFTMMVREVTSGEEFTGTMRNVVIGMISGKANTMGSAVKIPMVI